MIGENKHILNTVKTIEHQILRENYKSRANDSISISP